MNKKEKVDTLDVINDDSFSMHDKINILLILAVRVAKSMNVDTHLELNSKNQV